MKKKCILNSGKGITEKYLILLTIYSTKILYYLDRIWPSTFLVKAENEEETSSQNFFYTINFYTITIYFITIFIYIKKILKQSIAKVAISIKWLNKP